MAEGTCLSPCLKPALRKSPSWVPAAAEMSPGPVPVTHGTISHKEVISLPFMGFLLLLGTFSLLDLNFSAVLHLSAFKRWFISIFSFVLHRNDRDFNVVQKIRKALLK